MSDERDALMDELLGLRARISEIRERIDQLDADDRVAAKLAQKARMRFIKGGTTAAILLIGTITATTKRVREHPAVSASAAIATAALVTTIVTLPSTMRDQVTAPNRPPVAQAAPPIPTPQGSTPALTVLPTLAPVFTAPADAVPIAIRVQPSSLPPVAAPEPKGEPAPTSESTPSTTPAPTTTADPSQSTTPVPISEPNHSGCRLSLDVRALGVALCL